MKQYFLCFVCLVIVLFQSQFGLAVSIGEKAPDLEVLNGSSSQIYRLADFKDKVLFVNFWATWDETGKGMMPSIQSLYNRFKNDSRFQIVNILYRDDYQKALEYMTQNNYDYPFYLDSNNRTARSYGLSGVPETYIIDKIGTLRHKVIGPTDWNSQNSISLIARLLDETVDTMPTRSEPQASYSDKQAFGVCGTLCGSFIFIIIAVFVLNIALLVWVAKDAKNRGMGSSVGWIFLILFTGVIGLIIYLFSRPKGELVICDVCKNKKFKVKNICPHCGNSSSSVAMKTDISRRPQSQFCKQCGKQATPDSLFCSSCGGKMGE